MTRGRTPRRGRPCWPILRSPVLAALLVAAVVLGLVVMHAVSLTGASPMARHDLVPAMTHSTTNSSEQVAAHPVVLSAATSTAAAGGTGTGQASFLPVGTSTSTVLPDSGHGPSLGTPSGEPADVACVNCAGGTHSGALMTCTLILLITLVALVPPQLGALGVPLPRLWSLPRPVPARLPHPRAPSLLQIGVCRT